MKPEQNIIFEKTYDDYLAQVRSLEDVTSRLDRLGLVMRSGAVVMPLFDRTFFLKETGLVDAAGRRPDFAACVILLKYLLLCPESPPAEKEWVTYRGLKDSGPLTKYFANDVERALADCFGHSAAEFMTVGRRAGGVAPDLDAACDAALRFEALPRVPLIIQLNEADADFPASCTVLFERRAERYLDAECLAVLGRYCFARLGEL
ncbi:MAG: DUF3786 domain-containing protein [Thermodesulfobacteriota bacterium]